MRKANFQFSIESGFPGYFSKPDKTATAPRRLVSPSQNVLINDGEKVATRGGYSLDSAADASLTPNRSGITWKTSRGTERVLRMYDDELEVRFVDADGDINWVRLANGWSTTAIFSFATWWDVTEKLEELLFVVGNANIYEWGGGTAEVDSVAATTITKKGTPTWAQTGFYTVANKTLVNIRTGTEYTYTGGETTTTLTGIADTTGIVAGDILVQKIITNSNIPNSSAVNSQIGVLNNQVWYVDENSNDVNISTDSDYTSFTIGSPRVPGNGELLTLDGPGRAAISLDQDMLVATVDDDWYRSKFEQITVSTTLAETLSVKKLRTGKGKGLKNKNLVTNFGNAIIYLSNDNTLEAIERPQDLETISTQVLSDPVKADFDAEDFTNGQVYTHKNRVYVSAPVNGKVYILEFKQTEEGVKRFWQPPQILPVRVFVTVSDALYGLSSQTPEVYKLFDGTDDNDRPFLARAAFAYNSYGKRELLKTLDEWFTEGYISGNTELALTLNYELDGATQQLATIIIGGDPDILFQSEKSIALGDNPLGDEGLGVLDNLGPENPKFRHIFPFPPKDFFEIQPIYEMDSQDGVFEILAFGGNVRLARRQPSYIKKQITSIN